MLAVLSVIAARAEGKGEAGNWASGFFEREGRSVSKLKHEFVHTSLRWIFIKRFENLLPMVRKMLRGKDAQIQKLEREYLIVSS